MKSVHEVNLTYIILFCLCYTYFSTTILIFLACLTRIRSINKLLQTKPENDTVAQMIVKKSSKLHMIFHETIKLVNKCFSFVLVLQLFNCTFHCSFVIYSLYNVLFNDLSIWTLIIFVNGLLYLTLLGSLIIPLIVVSNSIKQECLKFVTLFERFELIDVENFDASCMLKVQAPFYETQISCGLFDVDWKIFFGTFVSILSNTIILIQFDIS